MNILFAAKLKTKSLDALFSLTFKFFKASLNFSFYDFYLCKFLRLNNSPSFRFYDFPASFIGARAATAYVPFSNPLSTAKDFAVSRAVKCARDDSSEREIAQN